MPDAVTADTPWMRLAIQMAREAMTKGQTPFGAVIVKDNHLVVKAHNVVWQTTDVTAHGEVHAIRLACAKLKTIELRGCTIYSSTEPCPMCFSAIHWAGIERIVYAAAIPDAQAAGFNELAISNHEMKRISGSTIEITGDFLREEAVAVFHEFVAKGGIVY